MKKDREKRTKQELEELMGQGWRPPESENKTKKLIKTAIKEKMIKTVKENGNQKSKTQYYLKNKKDLKAGRRAPYMDLLS